jgi:predicted TIM-barrel fold metal-dependent hydrolase
MFTRRTFVNGALASAAGFGAIRSPRAQSAATPQAPKPRTTVDVHCHAFNVLDLPVGGFIEAYAIGSLHIPMLGFLRVLIGDLETALVKATLGNAGTHAAQIALARKALDAIDKSLPEGLKKGREIAHMVEIATMTRQKIAETVAGKYPEVELFVPSLVDFDGWTPEGSKPPTDDLDKRIAEHENVALAFMSGEHGAARFHPFVSFNPRRKAAIEKVQDAIEKRGFIGVKLYPPCGFSAGQNTGIASLPDGDEIDARLEELFAYCEDKQVPILAHTNASNAFRRGSEFRASPVTWERTLAAHPKLRLDLGHFGHDHGVVEGCPNVECLVWSFEIGKLMRDYENVYADIGDSPLGYDPTYKERYLPLLKELTTKYQEAAKRIMYGSDWWMNEMEDNADNYYNAVKTSVYEGLPDIFNDVMGEAALRFLGFRNADGTVNRCNQNWKRLFAYYDAAKKNPKRNGMAEVQTPKWLADDVKSAPLVCPPWNV